MNRMSGAIVGALLLGLSGRVLANIQGSPHDFTATGGLSLDGTAPGGLGGVTELCQTCHTPHRPVLNTPLWAHNLSQATYALYNENTDAANGQEYRGLSGYTDANGNIVNAYDKTSIGKSRSRLCLSCHDGTVAVNSFAGMDSQGSGDFFMTDDHIVTYDAGNGGTSGGKGATGELSLKGSHPVGVNYAQILAAPGAEFNNIFDPTTGKATDGSGLKLEAGRVQCTTCHNPHFKNDRMLVTNMQGSNYICTKCHNK